jgi:predicted kinase
MDLIILIGLQASGKTTFREVACPDAGYVVVSKDRMGRRSRKAVRQEVLIRDSFEAGLSVVVDNTNPSLEDRAELIKLGRQYQVASIVGYHFKSTVDQSLERNARREGKALVPRVGILGTAKAYVPPTLAEGFDELYEVTWGPRMTFIETRVR